MQITAPAKSHVLQGRSVLAPKERQPLRGVVPQHRGGSILPIQHALLQETPAGTSRPAVALKEWAALVTAIGEGKQTILLRKGGIREGPFRAPASSFFLFPTSFHSEGRLLKPDAAEAYSQVVSSSSLSNIGRKGLSKFYAVC